MIPVVEHFYSFQGEGKYVGTPSIFIRLGGCNLGCRGFGVEREGIIGCDSLRAVHDKFASSWQSVDDLIEIVESYLRSLDFKPDIVVTGGEPLLHYQNETLLRMLGRYVKSGFRITFETNATISVDFERYPIYRDVVFAMSVKLQNSGEPYSKRVDKKAIKALTKNAKESFFKFVLSTDDRDNSELKEIVSSFPNTPIYCMPMGSTAKELSKNDRHVASFCIKYGYNYVDRMHIRLWDNEEGR
jgi:organic radical activating enzyme